MAQNPILLTKGEALTLSRRRSGMSLEAAVKLFGFAKWPAWEKDLDVGGCPTVAVGTLAPGEWCWLLRRRHRLQVRDVTGLTGLGQQWVRAAELGTVDATPLVEWWGRYLYAYAQEEKRKAKGPSPPT